MEPCPNTLAEIENDRGDARDVTEDYEFFEDVYRIRLKIDSFYTGKVKSLCDMSLGDVVCENLTDENFTEVLSGAKSLKHFISGVVLSLAITEQVAAGGDFTFDEFWEYLA